MSNLPKKIKCTCCGEDKAVRAPVLQKRIDKAGSLKKLLETYLCRDCRPEVTKRTAKVVKKITHPTFSQPAYELKGFEDGFEDEISFITSHTCLMPNIALAGKCSTCPFFAKCTVKDAKGNLYKTIRAK